MANKKHKFLVDDSVIVIAGRSKGKRGEITEVLADGRLKVSGVNLVKKHQRPDPNKDQRGGIVSQEAPIHCSNVAIYNSKTGKADRIGFKIEDGKKTRIFKSTGESVSI